MLKLFMNDLEVLRNLGYELSEEFDDADFDIINNYACPHRALTPEVIMNNSKKTRITFILIIFLWTISACYFEESRSSIPLSHNQYRIDPENILETISRGGKNIFTPIETPSSPAEFQSVPVDWKQSDYLAIANSLHEFVWGESLDNWKLNVVNFSSMDCDKMSYGFEYVRFVFFKSMNDANNDDEYRVEHGKSVV